jgi:hypothetical protein
MAVVEVGVVDMLMPEPAVPVPVRMGFGRGPVVSV